MTPSIEHLIAAGVRRDVAERWLPAVRHALYVFGIDTPSRIAAWVAQTAHESGGYTMLEENLNYRAATMAACWPARFAVLGPDKKPLKDTQGKNIPNKFALAIERKPETIANVVYSARMGNGPVESGEGWRYRGRGLKQLTGKDNYTRCGQSLKVDLLETPDLLLQPEHAALSAAWFWSANGCNKFADAGDIEGLTKRINGGLIGIDDRKKRYKAALAAMS